MPKLELVWVNDKGRRTGSVNIHGIELAEVLEIIRREVKRPPVGITRVDISIEL